jgi:ketosteroid isomerase-like protein
MRNTPENRILNYNSRFLGSAILVFGLLKFFEPFHTWFHIQIVKSGLPPLAVPLGIAGETSIGLCLLLAPSYRQKIKSLFAPILRLASAGLIVNMAVAVYVHLQPEVPASVLPLGIKPPFIPLGFMLLAGLNLLQLAKATGARQVDVGLAEPLATEDAFFGALVRGDVETLRRVLADEFVLVDVMRGAEVGRSDMLDAVHARRVGFTALDVVARRVRRYGETSIVVGRTEMRGESDGQPFAVASRYTHVLVWSSTDGWRLVSAQGTPIVE